MQDGDLPLALVKAMVVDDHDPIRKAMKRILMSMGIKEVIECFDGSDAVKEFGRQSDINLVLCDIYMRKVSGFDVLSQVRNRSIASDIPFLIVTGESNKDDIVKASDLGADDYLIKPFQAEVMVAKVKGVLTKFYSPSPLVKTLRHGDRLMLTHQYDKALEVYAKALQQDPTSKRTRHAHALALYHTGEVKKAIANLTQNAIDAPAFYKNFASLANIHLTSGHVALAIDAMEKELELNPKQAQRQVELANLLFKKEDMHGAMTHYREALKENAKNKGALYGMGKVFSKLGDFEKALYYFKRMRRQFPSDSRPLKAIVSLCLSEGKDRKAELFLFDEKNLHPERYDAYLYLAKFYVAQQKFDQAVQVLTQLLERDPENKEALLAMGSLKMRGNDVQGAIATLTQVIKDEPNFEAYLSLAQCEQKIGHFENAIGYLHQALLLIPFQPTALLNIAFCYQKLGDANKAVLSYLLAGKAGAPKEKCAKGVSACKATIAQRRKQAWPKSAA